MRTLPTPTLARFARHRSAAFVAIAALLVQTVAPALDAHRRDRARRTLAEGVLLVDDAELATVWGGDANDIAPFGGEAMAGLGVNMGTGHTVMAETDVSIPLVGKYGLTVSRVQSSHQFDAANDAGETLLGTSWWCNWDSYVYHSGDDIVWVMPNGNRRVFSDATGTGQTATKYFSVVEEGLSATLLHDWAMWSYDVLSETEIQTDPDSYTITTQGKEKWRFERWGFGTPYLVEIEDDAGNRVTIERDDEENAYRALKVKAHATDGRYLEFNYKTATNLLEEVRLKSAHDGGLNELLVTYAYGESHPYVPETNLRSVEFPNGTMKLYTYGSNEAYDPGPGLQFTHIHHAADNTEPSRTLAEKSIYYDAGSGWVEQALYRADWHEHSEGWDEGQSEAWIEHQYLYDLEASAWMLAHSINWTIEGDGDAETYHAQGGTIAFEGNVSYVDAYTADAKGDMTSIGSWYDDNPTTTPSYKVDRTGFRRVSVHYRPPGFEATGQDATYDYRTTGELGYTHDSYGLLTASRDYLGRLTTYAFDTSFNLPSQVRDIAGNMTSFTFNGDRRVTSVRDVDGRYATYAYDALGNTLTEESLPGVVTTYTYSTSAGTYGYLQSVQSPDGTASTIEYNAYGQPTRLIGSGTSSTVTFAYADSLVPFSAMTTYVNNLNQSTLLEYDSRGLITGMVDPQGKRTTSTYDAFGRIRTRINPIGITSTCQYDAHGRLVRFFDGRNNPTTYEFDAASRLIGVVEAGGASTTAAYLASSAPHRPTSIRSRTNELRSIAFDIRGRYTSVHFPGTSRTITYDYASHTTTNPYGALSRVRDSDFASGWHDNFHFEYIYASTGTLIEERYPDGKKLLFGFDVLGRLGNIAFDGVGVFSTTYDYDAISRLSRVSNSFDRWVEFGYHASGGLLGSLQQMGCSNGSATTFDYSAMGPEQSYIRVKHDPASGGNLERFYLFNTDSTVQAVYDDYAPNWSNYTGYRWRYFYDDAGRLTQEARQQYVNNAIVATPLSQVYTYDAAGNRLTRSGSGTGYAPFGAVGGQTQHNDLSQLRHHGDGSSTWVENTYDTGGNLIGRTDNAGAVDFDWSYTWGPEGRLNRVQESIAGTDVRYVYDYRGRLVEREDESASSTGPRRRYYYFGNTPVVERAGSYSGSYSWSNDVYNSMDPEAMLGHVLIRRTGGSVDSFLHYDLMGNAMAESNTSGAVTAACEYDAWGRPVLGSAAVGWVGGSLHHSTTQWDAEAGLFYAYHRWHDPETGRFASPAPFPPFVEERYAISGNDPMTMVDPLGAMMWNRIQRADGAAMRPGELDQVIRRITKSGIPYPNDFWDFGMSLLDKVNIFQDFSGSGLYDPNSVGAYIGSAGMGIVVDAALSAPAVIGLYRASRWAHAMWKSSLEVRSLATTLRATGAPLVGAEEVRFVLGSEWGRGLATAALAMGSQGTRNNTFMDFVLSVIVKPVM